MAEIARCRFWLVSALLLLQVLAANALAAAGADENGDHPVCTLSDDDEPVSGKRFTFGDTCVQVSGSTQFTGQRASAAVPRFGSVPALKYIEQNLGGRIEAARRTPHGFIKFAFETDWTWNSDSGPDDFINLNEASVAYLGFTLGYTTSLMDFWNSNFQFKASAPDLSSYLASREVAFAQDWKLAVAVEAGPPSARGASTWEFPDTPPYYTARLKYEKDDTILQASVAARETEVNRTPLITAFGGTTVGWAATVGATLPLTTLAEGDKLSAQVVYAENARVFLGTTSDASLLAALIPAAAPLPSKGWSALMSLEHNWTDKWSSNVFASRVQVDLDHFLGQPGIRTLRYGANVIYAPNDNWEFGGEFGYLDAKIDLDGVLGVLQGTDVKAKVGFVWVKWQY